MSSSPSRESSSLYRPPSQRKPSATLGKPSPVSKFGTRTPRGPPSRNSVPPTPVTPSPFKARSRPASAASTAVAPDEAVPEPGTESGALATKTPEVSLSLAASTDTLVDSKELETENKGSEEHDDQGAKSEEPPVKDFNVIGTSETAPEVVSEVKLPTLEAKIGGPSETKAADESRKDSAGDEVAEVQEPQDAVERRQAPEAVSKDINAPTADVDEVAAAPSEPTAPLGGPDGVGPAAAAASPMTPSSSMMGMATLSNKDWSERDDDASSVAGSVAASVSERSTKGSKDKKEKEKRTKEAPKGSIQLGNHVIHPRKPGEPVPEWTPQQVTEPKQAAKPKERDEAKTAEILKRLHALEATKPPTARKPSVNMNGNADSSAGAVSQAELHAKWEAQYKELSNRLEDKLDQVMAAHQLNTKGHIEAQRNKLEAQLLNQQAKFDSQQSKLDAQLAAYDRKFEQKMGEQTTSLQAAMETFMTVEARAAEQASHQDAWASRIEDEQDGLEARLAALRGEVSRVGPMIAASETAFDERVAALTKDVNERLSSAASSSQAFEQRLEGRLKSQESDVGRLISKIASLESKMKDVATLEKRLADQQKALDAQLLVAAKLEGKLGELDQLASQVKSLQASLDLQIARNDTLEEALKKQQALVGASAKEREQLEVRLSSISMREELATSTVGNLQFRVNELERRARTSAAREGPLLAGAITRLVLARFEPKRLATCDPSKVINLARSTLLPDAKGRVISKHYAKETQPIFAEHHLRSLFANATPGAILTDGAVLSMAVEAARTAADVAHEEEEKASEASQELASASEAAVHPGADVIAAEQRLLAAHEALQIAQEKRMLAVQERERTENLVKIVLACSKDVERAWSAVEDPTDEERKKYEEFLPRVESVELELALRDDSASEYVEV